jgi:hypothetical protein
MFIAVVSNPLNLLKVAISQVMSWVKAVDHVLFAPSKSISSCCGGRCIGENVRVKWHSLLFIDQLV